MIRLSEEVAHKYRLVLINGWYFSKQGMILTENMNVNNYLSKVLKANELDDKVKEYKKRYEK